MTVPASDIWVYLARTPLLWLALTVTCYYLSTVLYNRSHQWPLLNPVLVSMVVLVAILLVTGTPYNIYFEGAQFVHFLLGPTTVALAIPLFHYAERLKRHWLPFAIALLVGCSTAIISVWGLSYLTGLSHASYLSMLPKSITTPIAMGVSQEIGGHASLTAVLVILTGILGAVFGPSILSALRITHYAAQGFAIGISAHGIGTARVVQIHPEIGAFAGLAMGLNGIATAVLVPLFLKGFG